MDGEGGHAAVLRRVARTPELRRLLLAFATFSFAEQATWLAMLVFAFDRGGVGEAGVVAFVLLVPAIVVAPFAAFAGDRFRPERALAWGYTAQALSLAATAAAMFAGRPLLAYAAAGTASACITFTRPVMGALLPTVTRTPYDLIAANVLMGSVEHGGMFLGPALAGVVLALGSPALVFACCSAIVAIGAVLAFVVGRSAASGGVVDIDAGDVVGEVFGGFRAIRRHTTIRVLIGLTAIVGIANGATDVLSVTYAADVLGGGGGAAGLLGGGYGLGAVIGSGLVAGLVGRAQVSPYLLRAAVLLAVPYVLLAATSQRLTALAAFVVLGAGESVLRIAASVAVQRRAPSDVLARVFGVIEGLQMAAIAAGSLLVSLLVPAIGLTEALLALGCMFGLVVVGGTIRLRRLGGDRPPPPAALFERLLRDPVLAPLPAPALERIAETVEPVSVPAGTDVVVEGDEGDRYYLVVSGTLTCSIGGCVVEELDSFRSFGEVALLRDVPRLATVTSRTDVELLAVSRDEFLTAVTGHPQSRHVATGIVQGFLGG